MRVARRGVIWGIIPACAGSTTLVESRIKLPRDHPRMRGEHIARARAHRRKQGSSPHARGARRQGGSAGGRHGIIPACAGSTTRRMPHQLPCWDHPRMRGEHLWLRRCTKSTTGSSPHARGALVSACNAFIPRGIIPACAGSTQPHLFHQSRSGDHPRMRGEHSRRVRPSRG